MADGAFDRARQVFDGALTQAPNGRAAFLDEACGADRELRREVESLLAAHEEAGEFLSGGPPLDTAGTAAPAEPAPRTRPIGPYRILGVIARGGMGTVYRAVRDDDAFQKAVALKLVRGGASGELVERRFRQERQILGRLQHPNIAAILDGGATEDGQPYLVMEYVEGKPITAYCDALGLGTRQRLALFAPVCAAVQYAHQNLVVHRDLKPDNILVTADGTPKLLDFGIAKLLAAGIDPDSAPTATLLPMMTPEYASPEQVKGEPVTTASDVYSLGVLLYELLAGRRPYVVKTDSMEEIVRTVCQTEPPPPSAPVGARARDRSELKGDLDTIVMKALRKDPRRRYASVQELAEDLQRYLDGLPVRARPDTLRYRASKFVGRHRAAVAAAAVVLLALVGGLAATARQARIAERERALAQQRFQDVRRLANSLIFELHDKIRSLAGATEARKLLVQRAAEYLDLLSAGAPEDAALAEELAQAHERLAAVLGRGWGASLGDQAGALAHRRKALAIRERLAAEQPGDLERQRQLARSLQGIVYAEPEPVAGLAHAQRSIAIAERLVAAQPDRLPFQQALVGAHYALASVMTELADWTAALSSFQAAAGPAERALALAPGDPSVIRDRALCEKRIGGIMIRSGRYAEAVDHYGAALKLDEARVAISPQDALARRDVSVTYVDLSFAVAKMGHRREAVAHLRRALEIREELTRADPKDVQARMDLVSAHTRLGAFLTEQGEWREALRYLELAAAETLPRAQQDLVVEVLSNKADAHERAGHVRAMLSERRQALELNQALLAEAPNRARQLSFAELSLALGNALTGQAARPGAGGAAARWREARAVYTFGLQPALELHAGNKLIGEDVDLPGRLRAGVDRCDRALGTTGPAR